MKTRITSDGRLREITMTKAEVIEALLKEPLADGNWIDDGADGDPSPTCKVCAVGAVLRNAGIANRLIPHWAERVTDFSFRSVWFQVSSFPKEEQVQRLEVLLESMLVDEHNFLGALSRYFETLCPIFRNRLDLIRPALVDFVQRRFPEEIVFQNEAAL